MSIKRKTFFKEWGISILTFILAMTTLAGSAVYLKPYITNAATSEEIEVIGSSEVEMSTYFINANGEKNKEMEATTTEDIYLCFSINVLKEGYFNGKITIENNNFEIVDEELDEKISSIESNVITLQQINNGEAAEFKLKVEIKKEEEYDLNLLNSETKITLTGTYTNSKKEKEINETGNVKLTYNSPYSEEEETLNLEVITNGVYEIEGENKRLIQILVKNALDGNNYPINETKIAMTVPEDAEEVYVYSRGTSLTNGKSSNEEIEEDNINWDKTNQTLEILLENNIEQNDGQSIVTWKETGTDSLIVTYILPEESEIDEIEATSSIYLYDGYIEEKETTIITSKEKIEVEEEKNEIVTAKIASEDTSIYKGMIYSGEEKTINTITKLEINYAGIENEITVEGVKAKYQEVEENEETKENEIINELEGQIKINATTIDKARAEKILGENGYISIIVENVEIARITTDMLKETENEYSQTEYATITIDENNIKVQYNLDKEYSVNIVIENAENQGVLYINNEYSLINEEYTREDLSNINNLNLTSNIQTKEETAEISTNIELENTTTKANFQINNGTLTENEETEGVQFLVLLRNDDEKYDLYTNPEIEIELPAEIENIEISNVKLVYNDGLEIVNSEVYENEEGKNIIKITMEGEQTSHQINSTSKGTYIVITTNLKLGEIEETEETSVNLNITNNETNVSYENNATLTKNIKCINVIKAASTETEEASTNNEETPAITVEKTASVSENSEVYERQIIMYTISVTNNTNSTIENVTITDDLPDEVTYVKYYTGGGFDNGYKEVDLTAFEKTEVTLEAEETLEFQYAVIVNQNSEAIGNTFGSAAVATYEGSEKTFESNVFNNIVKEAKIEIAIAYTKNITGYIDKDNVFAYIISVKNLTDTDLSNISIVDELVSDLTYYDGLILGKIDGESNIYADDTTRRWCNI